MVVIALVSDRIQSQLIVTVCGWVGGLEERLTVVLWLSHDPFPEGHKIGREERHGLITIWLHLGNEPVGNDDR